MSRWALVLCVALVASPLLAGCVTPGGTTVGPASAGLPVTAKDAATLVHKAGDNLSARATDAVKPMLMLVGHDAAEPTLGILKDGTLIYAAATFKNDVAGQPFPGGLPRTDILRSEDKGATWKDVTPYFPGGLVREHPETGDPYVYVDTETGRVFDIDQRLLTTCYTVVTSDDKGATWTVPPSVACTTPGVADHQTIVAAKPRMLPVSPLYPKVVLVCYNVIATSVCTRSLDGGATFQAAGPVGTQGAYPENVDPALENPDFLCSGLVGHLKAAPDGTVYLPRRQCSTPMVAVTQDDGTTWSLVQVSKTKALNHGGTAGMDPTVAVDKSGNVYYVYQGADGHLLLVTSADKGKTWSEPVDVLAPGLTVGNLAALSAGADGTLALAYYGSDVEGGPDAGKDAVQNATWNGYLAVIQDALAPQPTVTTTRVNGADDPLFRGACAIGRCGSVRDFIDVVVDADGRPWASFVDACVDKCAAPGGQPKDSTSFAGALATLETGFSLWDPTTALPALDAMEGHEH